MILSSIKKYIPNRTTAELDGGSVFDPTTWWTVIVSSIQTISARWIFSSGLKIAGSDVDGVADNTEEVSGSTTTKVSTPGGRTIWFTAIRNAIQSISAKWNFNSGLTIGGAILLKNDNNQFRVRNLADTANADIICKDLYVEGTVTTLDTTQLSIDDNSIVLNKNVTGSPILDAEIRVKRGTQTDARLFWNESTMRWQAGMILSPIMRQSDFQLPVATITGTPSSATFLRGDGTWAALPQPTSGIQSGNAINFDVDYQSRDTTPASATAISITSFSNAGIGKRIRLELNSLNAGDTFTVTVSGYTAIVSGFVFQPGMVNEIFITILPNSKYRLSINPII